jgi:hypothetical protein
MKNNFMLLILSSALLAVSTLASASPLRSPLLDQAKTFHGAACTAYSVTDGRDQSPQTYGIMVYARDARGARVVYNKSSINKNTHAAASLQIAMASLAAQGTCATVVTKSCMYLPGHLYCTQPSTTTNSQEETVP